MEKNFENYLGQVEKILKPMAVSERLDILLEIESEIKEMELEGKSEEEIKNRLGDPKELARAYLQESLIKDSSINFKKIGTLIAFYSIAGSIWLFVLPITSVLAGSLLLCGILVPIAGIIKFSAFLVGMDLPWIGVQVGSFRMSAQWFLPYSIFFGIILYFLGKAFWKLTLKLIRGINHKKINLQS